MDTKPKVVIDTNVLVSATFQKVSPILQTIYQALKSQRFILITSPEMIEEVVEVINRDYIIKLSHTNKEDRRLFIEVLLDIGIFTSGKVPLQKISRDAKDDKFLACAYEAKADYLVTGDKDLLVLKQYKRTKIIKPGDFVEILNKS